ncbi:N-acetylmuramoyl-L-alanine amidase [Desulfonispora thiosulfatigenes DSM 11270]|uniref:N-acetylmuramoyl-L-alanine amidase n=1 Tax=Desulfonispora thiosulfatigenes DSM 11270 TaxID=656914 RepID=A0A1W1V797_DESTI|nr:N-acetylmuramoyl-L-alanine amidase [Desulfonispora thiosulfatigenes]SMB89299.1 N-acetylmuramoyl-L-alanine amidase [Desulfonispora thiosulfatigenes DSM 11270]
MRRSFFIVINLNLRLLLTFSIFLILIMFLGFSNPALRAFSNDARDTLIVIDPGHGGIDGGAVHGTEMEKNINLDFSLKLYEELKDDKFNVVMTRDSDVSLEDKSEITASRYLMDLNGRKSIINNSNAKVFVSIHSDAQPLNLDKRGVTIFYYPTSVESKNVAEEIAQNIDEVVYKKMLKNPELKSTVIPRNLYVLRESSVPGVLIEVGFLTNAEDKKLLVDSKYQEKMALAIKKGLIEYLKTN